MHFDQFSDESAVSCGMLHGVALSPFMFVVLINFTTKEDMKKKEINELMESYLADLNYNIYKTGYKDMNNGVQARCNT